MSETIQNRIAAVILLPSLMWLENLLFGGLGVWLGVIAVFVTLHVQQLFMPANFKRAFMYAFLLTVGMSAVSLVTAGPSDAIKILLSAPCGVWGCYGSYRLWHGRGV